MNVTDGSMAGHLAALGNDPAPQAGKVEVWLTGSHHGTADSGALTLYAEGLCGTLDDGRRFVLTNGGALVIDALAAPESDA